MYVVFSTFPNEDKAKEVAKALVEGGEAACVWVTPKISSFYIWRGELTEDSEVVLIAKTVDEKLESCVRKIKEMHPYEVPEIIAVKADYVLPEYERWAKEVQRT